jgi:hypothetical protein
MKRELAKSIGGSGRTDGTKGWGHFKSTMTKKSIMERESAFKKKFKGSSCFSQLKSFKTTIVGDIKQWSSRHCRRHRLGRSIVE